MTPLYKLVTETILDLDYWYAEGVQKHLMNEPEYRQIGESLKGPLQDYHDAIDDFKSGQPISKKSKELVLKSLEQDVEYLKRGIERLKEAKPVVTGFGNFFMGLLTNDLEMGIEEIKQLPEREDQLE
jgi:hypothetical protein